MDVAVLLVTNGYIDARLQDMFAYDLVQGLKKSGKIDRVTLLPDFLIPEEISFDTIQELGVRSLSEYVLVFDLDATRLFRWTKVLTGQYEVHSSISFIMVDSGTSAMLAADRLYSVQAYEERLFEVGELERAQRTLFSEQAKLLGEKLDALFGGL